MPNTSCITTVLMFFLLCLPVLNADCPYKECFCSDEIITCTGIIQKEMPAFVGTNITGFVSLIMDDNHITTIHAGSLPPGLQDMSFEKTPLVIIDDTAFDGISNTLNNLVMDNISFTKVPNAFGQLRVLSYLHLSDCNITDWNDNAMKNIGQSLKELELANVGMTEWPSWLESLSHLTDLTIVGNYFSSIPDNGFDAMVDTLTTLNLYSNRLIAVPKAVSKLKKLNSLFLFQNHISDVRWLSQLSNISSLSLSENLITNTAQLSQALKPFAVSLTIFDIKKNLLTSIPDLSFLTQVDNLDFTYNKISDSYSGAAQPKIMGLNLAHNALQLVPQIFVRSLSLTEIYLSYNSITVIQATDFHSQTTYVDLGYNLITELTDSSFPVNSSIMYLLLNNNPLTKISIGAFKNLPNLFEFNLQSTKITRLPLALSYLTKIGSFDVSNIDGLVCTCLEKDLADWVKKIGVPGQISGYCGRTSVFDFFINLSPSCP